MNLGAMVAAGGFRSTLHDMLRYAAANLAATSTLEQAMAAAQAPRIAFDGSDRIGLAWITSTFAQRPVVWHDGGTLGASTFIGLDPERHQAAVVLSASRASIEDIGIHALAPAVPLEELPRERPLTRAVGAPFTGRYTADGDTSVTIRRASDHLVAVLPAADPMILHWTGADRFFSRAGYQVTFRRTTAGAVGGFDAILPDGTKITASRS